MGAGFDFHGLEPLAELRTYSPKLAHGQFFHESRDVGRRDFNLSVRLNRLDVLIECHRNHRQCDRHIFGEDHASNNYKEAASRDETASVVETFLRYVVLCVVKPRDL